MKQCDRCGHRWAGREWMCPACEFQPVQRDGILYFAPALARGNGTDATYQHDALAAAERSHFWFRGRAALVVWAIRTHFGSAKKLLDVGCGRGALVESIHREMSAVELAGAELLDAGLRRARQRLPEAEWYQLNAAALPFDREFDVVTSCDVLEHIDDDRAVARELFRAVVPGGGIVLTVPQHRWLWSAVDDYSHHRRRYARSELVAVVEDSGFVVERVTSFVTMLLPAILASRLKQRRLDEDFDPTSELKIGDVQNRLCGALLGLDLAAIRSGASLPVGSSLLLVARRPVE